MPIIKMITPGSKNEIRTGTMEEYRALEAELAEFGPPRGSSRSPKRRRITQITPDSTSGNEGNGYDVDEEKTKGLTRKTRIDLPTRNKDDNHFRSHSHIEIVIPVKDIVKMGNRNQITEKQQSSSPEKKDPAGVDVTVAIEPLEDQRPLTQSGISNNPTGRATEDNRAPPDISNRQARGRKRLPNPDETSTTKTLPTMATAGSGKSKHKRFGNEELSIAELDKSPVETHQQSQDADDSSDNDAPEVVARLDAQEKARNSVKNAARAIEDRDAIIRQRRKVQDTRLKSQAKAASMKRKRSDKVDVEIDKGNFIASLANPLSKTSRPQLPQFLPLEYLDDDIPPSAAELKIPITTQRQIGRGKRTKFFDHAPKKPKDLVKGSTSYRVAEAKGDGLLAPKMNKSAWSIKEAWQRRRARNSGRSARRSMNKGFLIKK